MTKQRQNISKNGSVEKWTQSIVIFAVYILVFALIYAFPMRGDFKHVNFNLEPGYIHSMQRQIEEIKKTMSRVIESTNLDPPSERRWMITWAGPANYSDGLLQFRFMTSVKGSGKNHFGELFDCTVEHIAYPIRYLTDARCRSEQLDPLNPRRLDLQLDKFHIYQWELGPILNAASPERYIPEGHFTRMLYFSVVTATTLGYGDIVPVTQRARLAIALQSFGGLILFGWIIARHTHRVSAV